MQENYWIELSRQNLQYNLQHFRKLVNQQTKFCAVIKAQAYGHGAQQVVQALLDNQQVDWWAVNSIDEALEIRTLDQQRPILILCDVPRNRYSELIENNLSLVVSHEDTINELAKLNQPIHIHIKVDTGVGRLGVPLHNLESLIGLIQQFPQIHLQGVMSHFANAEDVLEQDYALKQITKFEQARTILKNKVNQQTFQNIIFHMAATAATLLLPQAHYDMVRIGIGLYGLWPSQETKLSRYKIDNKVLELQPVMSWYTKIIHLKEMPKGSYIGYGCTYQLRRDSVIATLPVGYYEGYSRLLSNNADVLICGQRCSVVGRISMHMITVDVTDIAKVSLGDNVVLLGKDGDSEITAEELAQKSQTINYELVTRINRVVPRVL